MTRLRDRPGVLAGIGVAFCLLGAVILLSSVSAWTDRAGYRRADPCSGTRQHDCVRDVPAVVLDTYVSRRKLDEYNVKLRVDGAAGPDTTVVELPVPDTVFPALSSGREVSVRLWDGRVARVDVPGVGSAETEHSPLAASLGDTVLGLAVLVLGGGSLVAARQRSAGETTPPANPLARVLLAAFFPAMLAMFLVLSFDVYDPPVVAAAFLGTWLVAWRLVELAYRRRRARRR